MIEIEEGEFTTDDGVKLSYSVSGEGHPLVFVNALGSTKRGWSETAYSFSRYAKVITYNLRNQGKSVDGHGDDYLMDRHVRDLLNLVSHLSVNRFVGVGLSTGTRILSDFALTHPELVHSLVLMGYGGQELAQRNQIVFQSWLHALSACEPGDVEPFIETLLPWLFSPGYLAVSSSAIRGIAPAINRVMTRDGLRANVRASMVSLGESYERVRRTKVIKAPSLILQGELDILTPPTFLRSCGEEFESCTLKLISGSGHNVRIERRDEFEAAALEFLLADPAF